MALFFMASCLDGLVHFWCDMFVQERSPRPAELIGPGLMALAGIFVAGYIFAARVTLLPDAIEIQTLWSTKRMDFNRIRGYRECETTDSDGAKSRFIKLEPLGYQQPALEFQDIYNFDTQFFDWLRSLPKLGL